MLPITDMMLIALFVEAVVNAVKPIWTREGERFTVAEYVSMGLGVLLAVVCKINMLDSVAALEYPAFIAHVLYVLTGVAIGRGADFLYDLWKRLREWRAANAE